MFIQSQYEPVKIPEVDLWDFIFENERQFLGEKRESSALKRKLHNEPSCSDIHKRPR